MKSHFYADASGRKFHLFLACAMVALIMLTATSCWLAKVSVEHVGGRILAMLLTVAAVMPLPIYWHDKGRPAMQEAALMIPWALAFAIVLPLSVDAAARAGLPLQDANFRAIDHLFEISIPAWVSWASNYAIGRLVNRSYALLIPLLPISFLAVSLLGKWKQARVFVVANVAAFFIGLPMFALLPAVGPWYGYKTAALAQQLQCQSQLLQLRERGTIPEGAGVVCCPSFHVIWAILCAYALWGFKPLRIPAAILAMVIILSTMTTGWHYFVDVLAGAVVAIISLLLARRLSRLQELPGQAAVSKTAPEVFGPNAIHPV